jgi:hypothetical protein
MWNYHLTSNNAYGKAPNFLIWNKVGGTWAKIVKEVIET